MGGLEKVLGNRRAGTGEVRLSPGGELVIPPLSAEDIPAKAAALKEELAELLPLAPIASLLVELDRRTGFLGCFMHVSGKQARSPELKRNLLAVVDRERDESGPGADGGGVRDLLRHPGPDPGVVSPRGDPGGGERRGR
ncbi:hypothetical protein [Streptomyces albireticuli]|uniref:hypothetical protein n=1 Tax=Streptomyces albireticuli TaxID=1940 RepID=UPI00117F63AD|nr:hypothetical protein [Streptomyces albireticuli]MCD9146003.1 hypothetical protein [Streptomyces albireticuli]MCD9166228.1 hypothetical protein [Streptomyces albireticuli]MCD9196551.1 hypothetical protein [Streptomyces albireticuli]